MPFVDAAPDTTIVADGAPPQPKASPDFSATLGAAFRQDNEVVSTYRRLNDEAFPPDPNYNPLPDIQRTPYFHSHADAFVGSRSAAETDQIKHRIDGEEADRHTLDAAGWSGTVAQLAAGTANPTMWLIPGGELAAAGRAGIMAGRTGAAIKMGAGFGLGAAASEGVLQGTHETRTAGESAMTIASATLLGAIIGPLALARMSPAERVAAENALTHDRIAMAEHAGNKEAADALRKTVEPAPGDVPAGSALPEAAGAAATDTRDVSPVRTILGSTLDRTNPMDRTFGSQSVNARRTMADLAETPLRMEQNLEGVPTTSGPALSRSVTMAKQQAEVAAHDEVGRLFAEYRFGDAATTAPRLRAQMERFTGRDTGYMSFEEFDAEIAKAMRRGDEHDIPQVQQAAQFLRKNTYDIWKDRAIETGLFPEDVAPKGADSYLNRVYNKQAIAAKRNEFVDKVTDYYRADQATKAEAQTRLGAYNNALGVAEDTAQKLTAKIEKLQSRLASFESKAAEMTALNKFAFEKASNLSEPNRVGGSFETRIRNRGNRVAKIISGRRAEIADLESRLSREASNTEAMRAKIEAEIGNWQGTSAREAKAAIKAREKYAAEQTAKGVPPKGRLTSADAAIDKTVKNIIESDRDLSPQELRARADETTDRILSSADGRLSYEANQGAPSVGFKPGEPPRGPLAERRFAIPDVAIEDFLEKSALHAHKAYLRTVVPDVLLNERFGDTAMTEAFRKINEEYAAKVAATKSEKTATALEKERQTVISDLAGVRDRIRGVYGFSAETPMRNAARVANAVKNYNVISLMGMAAVSSIPDMAGQVFRHGLGTSLSDSWAPFVRYMMGGTDVWKQAAGQYRAMGIATETFNASRLHALNDITELYKPKSQVERALSWGADKFQLVSLLAPWTDWAKINASMTAGSEILRATKAAAAGTATKRQLTALAESNIDASTAARIAREFEAGGEVKDGVHLPNTADWKDATARAAFEGAVAREADIAVLTPGQEKPLWLSSPILSVFGQFKSFTASATQRILLANLQRADAQTLQGLVFSMGLGMLSYKLNSLASGKKTSDRPADWIKESIDRGGLLGWINEGNTISAKMTGGGVDLYRLIGADKPLSRYASRSVLDQLVGPTAGKIEALTHIGRGIGKQEWNESDTAAVRRLTAFQNLFYTRRLFDQVEASTNHKFGIEMKARP